MRDQHELDKLLKTKFDQEQFEFDEAYWEAAQALIEQNESKRITSYLVSWKGIGLLLLLLLLLGSIYGIWYNSQLDTFNQQVASLSLRSDKQIPQIPQALKPLVHSLIPSQTLPNKKSAAKSLSGSAENSPQLNESFNHSSSPSTLNSSATNNLISNNISNSTSLNNSSLSPTLTQTSTSISSTILEQEQLVSSLEKANTLLGENTIDLRSIEGLEMLFGKGFTFLNQFPAELSTKIAPRPPSHRHTLGIVSGTTLARGLINTGPNRASIGTMPYLGIRYTFDPFKDSPFLKLETGVYVLSRSGLNGSRTFRSVRFGFGVEETTVTLTPKALHALELPLIASLRIHNRHYLTLGGSFSYLMEVSTREDLSVNTIPTNDKLVLGYRKGFNKWDAGLTAGYRYYVGKSVTLNLQGYWGIKDLTDNELWENDIFDRNLQLRFFLTYDLFQF